MTVKDYVEKVLKLEAKSCKQFTFVIEEVRGSHFESRNTPVRCWWEWKSADIMDYIVLNEKQPQTYWLSGANINTSIKKGIIHSLLVMSREELLKYYSEEQGNNIIDYIDNQILKAHNMTREGMV